MESAETFGTVELNARKRTGSATRCSAERRNEELRFLFGESISLARGGFVGLAIEMKKGPDDGINLANEAVALADLGNHHAALAKFTPALAALQLNGDHVNAVHIHLLMIRCHVVLHEVSSRS